MLDIFQIQLIIIIILLIVLTFFIFIQNIKVFAIYLKSSIKICRKLSLKT
jgi:hypothetical protein